MSNSRRPARAPTGPAAPTNPAAEGGPALFRLVRFWSRRWVNQALAPGELDGDMRRVQYIQAVEAVSAAHEAGREATVTTVATHLGLDHSGASRIVRDTVAAGHLARADSVHDRRRVALEITGSGERLLDAAHDWQRRCFDGLTADWDEHDRRQLAGYLRRLADEAT